MSEGGTFFFEGGGFLGDMRSLTVNTCQQKVPKARIFGGGIHALRLEGVPFGGTVVLAISSPVAAFWLWLGCVMFLDAAALMGCEYD